MDLVAGAVQEAGVDKHHALAGSLDARLEVDRGAPLFVHDPDFERVAWQLEHVFDAAKQFVGERRFFSAVHLRLHDVDRAGAAVAARGFTVKAVDRCEAGQQTVENAFWHFVAIFVEDRIDGHQVTDVAHEQQRAAVQADGAAVGRRVLAVRVHGAGEGLAALGHLLAQIALHQAEPVAVNHYLVIGIDGGNRVFAVHDGGQGRFHQHVFNACSVGLADRARCVDLDFEVQAIVLEQHGGRRCC